MKAPRNIECENARKLIDLAVTGDLTADEEALLNAHLVECEDCRRRMATRKALWRNYPVGAYPSSELLQMTLASVARVRKPKRLSIFSLRPSVASLAASVLILIGALYAVGLLPFQGKHRNTGEGLVETMISWEKQFPEYDFAADIDNHTIQVARKSTLPLPAMRTGNPSIDNATGPPRPDGTMPVTFVH